MSRNTLAIAFWIVVILVAMFALDALGGAWLVGHPFLQVGLAAVLGGLVVGLFGFWRYRP